MSITHIHLTINVHIVSLYINGLILTWFNFLNSLTHWAKVILLVITCLWMRTSYNSFHCLSGPLACTAICSQLIPCGPTCCAWAWFQLKIKKTPAPARPLSLPSPRPSWQDSPAPDGPVKKKTNCDYREEHDRWIMVWILEAEWEDVLLFTVTVALLVAVPCELVATALYSAVSLTAHLQDQTAWKHNVI